jgi:uncharacterized membrane protein
LIPYGVACWGSVARYLGLLATTLDRFDDAERHFAFALERELEIGARPFVAHTLLAYAAMLLVSDAQRNRDRALAMLDESLGIARALEMDALAERISEELAQASMAGRAEVAPSPQSARETASVFRREGEFWTLEYEGTITRLKDTKGMRYIACLLEHAGEEIHSGELVMLGGNGPIGAGASVSQLGDAGELLDPRARAEYRRRLAELREELEEAEQANDLGRAERARDEVDMLAAQLSAAVGLGGRERRSGSTSERARLTVTKRIKLALHKITDAHPALGRHLGASVKTGIFCAYRPPTTEQGVWRL